jgi:polysaccharide pyruvyl transferase WcaK-like protein
MGNFGDDLFLKTFKQIFSEHNLFSWTPFLDRDQIDGIIVGGGDLLTLYSFNEYYFPSPLKNLPTWVYGVGVVDFYSEETWPAQEVQKYRDRFRTVRHVVVRDERSADYLKRLQIHSRVDTAPDIVFAYDPPHYPIATGGDGRTIGVCIFTYENFPFQKLAMLLSKLTRRGYRLFLIPVVNQANNPFSDYQQCVQLCEEIKKLHPQAEVNHTYREYDLEMTYSFIRSMDFLLTFKMHPALVALRHQVPVFCLSKMSKVASLLEQVGLGDFFCDFDRDTEELETRLIQFLATGKRRMLDHQGAIRKVERESKEKLLWLKRSMERELTQMKKRT